MIKPVFLAIPYNICEGIGKCEFWDTSNKAPLHRSSPPAAADTHICHWHSDHNLLSLFLLTFLVFLLAGQSEIFHLQRAVCSNNGSAGFPELPVPFFLILTWVLSWNVILHCIVSFEDLGIKPRELFFTHHCCCCMPRMLLGRQWHLVLVWWSVALQGDPAVSLVLCVVPHTNHHCSVSGDNRVSALAEQSSSSFYCL